MKKIIALALASVMVLTFAACGSKTTTAETTTETTSAAGVTLSILDAEFAVEDYAICIAKDNTDLLEQVDAALVTITENGVAQQIVDKYISDQDHDLVFQADAEGKDELHMATNAAFPPYEYYEGDKVVGIDAEMAAAIADELDMKLVIDDMEFDAIIVAVQSGKSDMGMAGMTVTEERLQNINFSATYATGIQSVIVPEGSEIASIEDLDNEEFLIGVQSGTTGDIYASDSYGDRVMKFSKGADAIQALVTGKIDCVIIDNEPAKAFVAANNK